MLVDIDKIIDILPGDLFIPFTTIGAINRVLDADAIGKKLPGAIREKSYMMFIGRMPGVILLLSSQRGIVTYWAFDVDGTNIYGVQVKTG